MAALRARPGMVGGFVGRQARRGGLRAGGGEQVGGQIGIRYHQPTTRRLGREARAGLDRQLIEREVLGPERQRAGQLGLPFRQRLAGAGINQVEADPAEITLGDGQRGQPLGDIVRAAQEAERGVVQRLQPQRHPVDPGRGEIGEARRLDRGRIGLEGDFDSRLELPGLSRRFDHGGDSLGRHQRGRAAAEEDRGQRAAGQLVRFIGQVGDQRRAPRRLVHFGADMTVEVAIGAFRHAERPVYVERQRAVRDRGGVHARRAMAGGRANEKPLDRSERDMVGRDVRPLAGPAARFPGRRHTRRQPDGPVRRCRPLRPARLAHGRTVWLRDRGERPVRISRVPLFHRRGGGSARSPRGTCRRWSGRRFPVRASATPSAGPTCRG